MQRCLEKLLGLVNKSNTFDKMVGSLFRNGYNKRHGFCFCLSKWKRFKRRLPLIVIYVILATFNGLMDLVK